MQKLAKYIRVNEESSDNHGVSVAQEDVIQNNLRVFLQYLESKQVININEVEQDRGKMSKLIQEIMQIDFQNFASPNFMLNKLQPQMHGRGANAQAVSDGDKVLQTSSGVDEKLFKKRHADYNTSGNINLSKMKAESSSQERGGHMAPGSCPEAEQNNRLSIQHNKQRMKSTKEYFSGTN